MYSPLKNHTHVFVIVWLIKLKFTTHATKKPPCRSVASPTLSAVIKNHLCSNTPNATNIKALFKLPGRRHDMTNRSDVTDMQ